MSSVRHYRSFRVAIMDPDGSEIVVTEKTAKLGRLRLAIEDDLTALVHGDISLSILDPQGEVESFLSGFQPGEEWVVRIERETNPPAWEIVFAGVLDLPLGVVYDRKAKTVEIQAFSYSKRLERASGENIKRTLTGRTGTGTGGTATLTMSSTTDVAPGDVFQITSATSNEEVTVKSVDSGTVVTLVANLGASYTAATMTPLTPYHRNRTLEYLAGQIFTEAGITSYDVDLTQDAVAFPVAGTVNDTNIPTALGKSIVPQDGKIRVVSNGRYYEQSDPTVAFVDTGAATVGQSDWTPYKATEPGTIYSLPTGGRDDGTTHAMDYDTGDYWSAEQDQDGTPGTTYLRLRKNAVNESTLDSNVLDLNYENISVEYDTDNGECWAAWQLEGGATYKLQVYNGVSASTYVNTYKVGGLRFCKALSRMVVYNTTSGKIEFHTLGSGKTKDFEITAPAGFVAWTFRVWDGGKWAAAVYVQGGSSYLRVWKVADWSIVVDHKIQTLSNSSRYATIYTDDDGNQHYLLLLYYVNGGVYSEDYFIVSTEQFGVIPYANFEGMSCAGALREACLVTGAVFRVNADGSANVRARGTIPSESVTTLSDSPLDWRHRPLWEWYRASVSVTGRTEDEVDIEEYFGETGDSANRLAFDSALVTTLVQASAIGTTYLAYLSASRVQEDATFAEDGTIPAPLDRVGFNGRSYQVLETDVDFQARRMALRLVSV